MHLLLLLVIPTFLAVLPQAAESRPPLASPVAPEMLPVEADVGTCPPDEAAAGTWVFLSDLPWRTATSGWQAIADYVLPERDVSFSRNPLVLAGGTYGKGLGTYPLSEVVFDLEGRYSSLQALLGLNDDAPPGAAAVYLVYADETLVYNSGAIPAATAPRPLDLCVAGVQRLRLVTALAGQRTPGVGRLSPDAAGSYANWADARVFLPATPQPPLAPAIREALRAGADVHWERLVGELAVYRQQGAAERLAVAGALGLTPDSSAAWPGETQAVRDATGRLVLAHRRLAVTLGFGGTEHAALTAVDSATGTLLIAGAGAAITTAAGSVDLTRDTEPAAPDAFTLARIQDPVLGPGTEARATLRLRQAKETTVEVRLALFDDQPYFTYQLAVAGWPAGSTEARISAPGAAGTPTPPTPPTPPASSTPSPTYTPQPSLPPPTRLDYLSAADTSFVLGDAVRYFADSSYVREGELPDDGLWRSVRLDIGKPAFVGGDARPGGIVLALLDEQRLPAWLVARRDPGHAAAAIGISQPLGPSAECRVRNPLGPSAEPSRAECGVTGAGRGPTKDEGRRTKDSERPVPHSLEGPRLLVEIVDTADLRAALANYRRLSAALFPPAQVPEWVRYQWGSWWVYGDALQEDKLRQQIDLIATYLSDLGPWHIVVDAGWQDIGWEGSGDLREDNRQKFPSGLRALVDYAHARGIRVILFYSAVYVHDGMGKGEWLGVPWLVQEHPNWFIRLTPEGVQPARYLFDYSHPQAREYLADVLASYVTRYDADGVKIDGLGDVEGQLIPFSERVHYLGDAWTLTPVMDIYRLAAQSLWSVKPDAFIESGWVNPAPAQAYAHSFRFGDESDKFDFGYPFPGLLQHFDYAAVQRTVLGQRPHIGAIFGGFNRPIADQWLGAALALGAQVSLGSDLNFVSPDGFAALRALLVHYRPFAGTTRTGPEHFGLRPSWAATTMGDLTFLGLMNRQATSRRLAVSLQDLGLETTGSGPAGSAAPNADLLAYDVAAGRYFRVRERVGVDVPAQTFRLVVLRRTPGVVWTTSSYEEQPQANGWRILVRGPAPIGGQLQFHLPGGAPGAVLLDGRPLPSLTPSAREGQTYDPATGVLTLRYVHAGLGAAPGDPAPARAIEILR